MRRRAPVAEPGSGRRPGGGARGSTAVFAGAIQSPAMQNVLLLLLLVVLLGVSGLFSGAETVLFSLSRHERARMKKSANRLDVIAATLVDHPRSLLTALLMGNMTCNIVIFVVSAILLARLSAALHLAGIAGGAGAARAGRDWRGGARCCWRDWWCCRRCW